MEKRYIQLFNCQPNLYAIGSPIIICAGALFKDEQNGKVLAIFRLRNISNRIINGIKIEIIPRDTVKRPIGEPILYNYLDLRLSDNEEIGNKIAIVLPNANTRSFDVKIKEVYFNNDIWTEQGSMWNSLGSYETLNDYFVDLDIAEEYRNIFNNENFIYLPQKIEDIWICSCGKVHKKDIQECCGISIDSQIEKLNANELKISLSTRINESKYNKARKLVEEGVNCKSDKDAIQKITNAISLMNSVENYKDAGSLLEQYNDLLSQKNTSLILSEQSKQISKKRTKKIIIILICTLMALCILTVIGYNVFRLEVKYKQAISLKDEGRFNESIALFTELNSYRKSKELLNETRTQKIEDMERLSKIRQELKPYSDVIAASSSHSIGLNKDGTVISTGKGSFGNYLIDDWSDIKAVFAGTYHAVGIKNDGTVLVDRTHYLWYGEYDVSSWSNIIDISVGENCILGVQNNGKVVSTGANDKGIADVKEWAQITNVSIGYQHSVGLKSDGTVVATGDNIFGQCDVENWNDIVAISAGSGFTIGLRADGTVVATGSGYKGQCDVDTWHHIVAISAGLSHTVGIKSDGTVVAVGDNDEGQCNVSEWKDIVAVAAGGKYTLGLKSDGTVVATGSNSSEQCNVSSWHNIGPINTQKVK